MVINVEEGASIGQVAFRHSRQYLCDYNSVSVVLLREGIFLSGCDDPTLVIVANLQIKSLVGGKTCRVAQYAPSPLL